MAQLPALPSVDAVQERLQLIFPDGTSNREYVTREMAAKSVFVALYVGAVEGSGRWIRPDQVGRMTDEQAAKDSGEDREAWLVESMGRSRGDIPGRWYSVNTREPIRDETLRDGLVAVGGVVVRSGLATTSPAPRYALAGGFAALFDPGLEGEELGSAVEEWRGANLSPAALARVAIVRRGAVSQDAQVPVRLPNGEVRNMAPGPSSQITKAVLEDFVPRFLVQPGLIWLSESGNQVVAQDDELARAIGLTIEPDRNLPDMILVDLKADGADAPDRILLVFVEVVATAGAVSDSRRVALLQIATGANFAEGDVTFVSAFEDRDRSAFRQSVGELAWSSFAWFASEPDSIVRLRGGAADSPVRLSELMIR